MNPFLFREALASVALEHPDVSHTDNAGMPCRICLAANGNAAAWTELYVLASLDEDRVLAALRAAAG